VKECSCILGISSEEKIAEILAHVAEEGKSDPMEKIRPVRNHFDLLTIKVENHGRQSPAPSQTT
jgi:hypothetical protein